MGTKATLFMTLVAILVVVIPVLFWHGTWFGRALTDEEISDYLANHEEKPRQTQHALVQISERMARREESVRKWHPQIIELAEHPLPELRLTIAWLMGQDPKSEDFHFELRELVRDDNPMVRRNAALSLAAFGDPAGRDELLGMLRPYTVTAEQGGVITNRLQEGDPVDRGTLLVRVASEGVEEPLDVRSPVPGVVREQLQENGSKVPAGAGVTLLGPDSTHAYEALRALYLVGTREDVETIRPFLRPTENIPAQVNQQARLTIEHLTGQSTN